ncbi:MAG: AraC family transcriptional regulator [Clostridia bacterium]
MESARTNAADVLQALSSITGCAACLLNESGVVTLSCAAPEHPDIAANPLDFSSATSASQFANPFAPIAEGLTLSEKVTLSGAFLGTLTLKTSGQCAAAARIAYATTLRAYSLLLAQCPLPNAAPDLFAGASAYICAHLNDDLSGDALPSALFVSRNTLARAVKQRTGLPLRLYVQSLRLDAARALLTKTALPIMQVAEMCGVNDFNYFSRIYRRRFGQPPSITRAQK